MEWLDGTDEAGWEDRIESVEQVRSDMERMARPVYGRGRARGAQDPEHDLDAARLNRAIPHIRAMLTAMGSHNRAAALEHGKAALLAL